MSAPSPSSGASKKASKAERMAREREFLRQQALVHNLADQSPQSAASKSSEPSPSPEGTMRGPDGDYIWVYERAELLDRIQQESDRRAKAESIAAQFIREKEAAEALRAQAESELQALKQEGRGGTPLSSPKSTQQPAEVEALKRQLQEANAAAAMTAESHQRTIIELTARVQLLEDEAATSNAQMVVLRTEAGQAARLQSEAQQAHQAAIRAYDEAQAARQRAEERESEALFNATHANQHQSGAQIVELQERVKTAEQEAQNAKAKSRGLQSQLLEVQRELLTAQQQSRQPSGELQQRDEEIVRLRAQLKTLQQDQRGASMGARSPSNPQTPFSPLSMQSLGMDQDFQSQVAQQLIEQSDMPRCEETDAYVKMLCNKAEKMHAKLLAETLP